MCTYGLALPRRCTFRVMNTPDPVKSLLASLPDDLYPAFIEEFDAAVSAVCALAHDPQHAGARIQDLAEVIRSWHLTLALMQNETWVKAVDEDVQPTAADVGSIEQLRQLLEV